MYFVLTQGLCVWMAEWVSVLMRMRETWLLGQLVREVSEEKRVLKMEGRETIKRGLCLMFTFLFPNFVAGDILKGMR